MQLKAWNPDLHAAVNLALGARVTKVTPLKVPSIYVIHSRGNTRYSRDGFNTSWPRDQKMAADTGVISARFRLHDLKVKALSNFEGDDLARFSGHKTKAMAEQYNRTPDNVTTLRRPTKRPKT